jgi:hypothetical protein
MNRRDFLRLTGFVSASLAFPRWKFVLAEDSSPAGWRTFDVTTLVEVVKPSGTTRVWLPTALLQDTPFQKTISNRFDAPGGTVELVERKADALGIVRATFAEGARPVLTLTSRVQTRDYAVDLSKPGTAPKASRSELAHFLQPTALMPTDGIVKQTALEATKGATTDVEKAKAIYEWIVANTFRNPKTRGCGVGDVRFMLESKDLSGKCADLNASLRRTGARLRPAGTRRVRDPRRQVRAWLSEPRGFDGQRDEGPALPRRGLSRQPRLGPRGSRGRPKGGTGRASRKPPARR